VPDSRERDLNPFAALGGPVDEEDSGHPLIELVGAELRAYYDRLLSLPVPPELAEPADRLDAEVPPAGRKH
jgi:hypothetical protein